MNIRNIKRKRKEKNHCNIIKKNQNTHKYSKHEVLKKEDNEVYMKKDINRALSYLISSFSYLLEVMERYDKDGALLTKEYPFTKNKADGDLFELYDKVVDYAHANYYKDKNGNVI